MKSNVLHRVSNGTELRVPKIPKHRGLIVLQELAQTKVVARYQWIGSLIDSFVLAKSIESTLHTLSLLGWGTLWESQRCQHSTFAFEFIVLCHFWFSEVIFMVLVVIAYFLQKKYILFFRQEWPVECLHARLSWTLWIIQSLLYCIVLLCLFLPESQTWMTSEGLNRQLLSMHFVI